MGRRSQIEIARIAMSTSRGRIRDPVPSGAPSAADHPFLRLDLLPVNRPGVLRYAQDPLHATHNAAGDAANGTANSCTHGACCLVANSGSLFGTANDALCLNRAGQGHGG